MQPFVHTGFIPGCQRILRIIQEILKFLKISEKPRIKQDILNLFFKLRVTVDSSF